MATIKQVLERWLDAPTHPIRHATAGISFHGPELIRAAACTGDLAWRLADGNIMINAEATDRHGTRGGHVHHNTVLLRLLNQRGDQAQRHFEVPFSALYQARRRFGTEPMESEAVRLLDSRADSWWTDADGKEQHTMGGALLGARGVTLLSVLDSTQRQGAYSLIALPGTPMTIDDALRLLMPEPVKELTGSMTAPEQRTTEYQRQFSCDASKWEHRRDGHVCLPAVTTRHRYEYGYYANGVRRQGEWWFVPQDGLKISERCRVRQALLPPSVTGTQSHRVTEFAALDGVTYVRGVVSHTQHEHHKVHLGKVWHAAYLNTALWSW